MSIGVGLRFNNRTFSKQSRRTLQATLIITRKIKKATVQMKRRKNYSNNEKIAEKTATKKKTIYIKIITTIFNNITTGFLCQSKNV